MTQIMLSSYSEVNEEEWSYNTMKPPQLTLKNLYKDLKWHIHLYKQAKFPLITIIKFTFLRIHQLIYYNKGWKEGGKK